MTDHNTDITPLDRILSWQSATPITTKQPAGANVDYRVFEIFNEKPTVLMLSGLSTLNEPFTQYLPYTPDRPLCVIRKQEGKGIRAINSFVMLPKSLLGLDYVGLNGASLNDIAVLHISGDMQYPKITQPVRTKDVEKSLQALGVEIKPALTSDEIAALKTSCVAKVREFLDMARAQTPVIIEDGSRVVEGVDPYTPYAGWQSVRVGQKLDNELQAEVIFKFIDTLISEAGLESFGLFPNSVVFAKACLYIDGQIFCHPTREIKSRLSTITEAAIETEVDEAIAALITKKQSPATDLLEANLAEPAIGRETNVKTP